MTNINYENELTNELIKLIENDGSVIISYLPTLDTRRVWDDSEIYCKYTITYDVDNEMYSKWYIWDPIDSTNTLLIESQATGPGKLFPIYNKCNISGIITAIDDCIKFSAQRRQDNNIKLLLTGIHKITDTFDHD